MAKYVIAATQSGPSGFRPWDSRLGAYQRANIVIPTDSSRGNDNPGAVTGGLGDFDLSTIPMWAWLVGAAGAAYYFFGKRRG